MYKQDSGHEVAEFRVFLFILTPHRDLVCASQHQFLSRGVSTWGVLRVQDTSHPPQCLQLSLDTGSACCLFSSHTPQWYRPRSHSSFACLCCIRFHNRC